MEKTQKFDTESKTYLVISLALNKLKTPFGETPWLMGHHESPWVLSAGFEASLGLAVQPQS